MDEQEQQNEAQEEQNVQMEPAPLSPPPSHTKLIIGIVAVFVLVVAGIAGAYFLLQPKTQLVNKIQSVSFIDDVELENAARDEKNLVSTEIDTSNWKTYRSDENNLIIKYPKNWVAENSFGVIVEEDFTHLDINFVFFSDAGVNKASNVVVLSILRDTLLEEYLQNYYLPLKKGEAAPRDDVLVNNINMAVIHFDAEELSVEKRQPECLGVTEWFFEYKRKVYHLRYAQEQDCISVSDTTTRDKYQEISRAMVNSIQLISQDLPPTAQQPNVEKLGDFQKQQQLKKILFELEIYYDFNEVYPQSLNNLQSLSPEIDTSLFLYAVNPTKSDYHLGVEFSHSDEFSLTTDADFNSEKIGWTNGFNGKDPIYDL